MLLFILLRFKSKLFECFLNFFQFLEFIIFFGSFALVLFLLFLFGLFLGLFLFFILMFFHFFCLFFLLSFTIFCTLISRSIPNMAKALETFVFWTVCTSSSYYSIYFWSYIWRFFSSSCLALRRLIIINMNKKRIKLASTKHTLKLTYFGRLSWLLCDIYSKYLLV